LRCVGAAPTSHRPAVFVAHITPQLSPYFASPRTLHTVIPQIKKIDAHSVSITITFCVQFVKSTMMKYFIESNTTPEVQKWQEAYFKHLKKVRGYTGCAMLCYAVELYCVVCVDSVLGVNCSGGAAVVNTVACNLVSMWAVFCGAHEVNLCAVDLRGLIATTLTLCLALYCLSDVA
jgi:hypothetical protein